MKKIFSVVAACLMTMGMMAQGNDPVIMKINGKSITRSEFEYSYNKNNSEGVIDKKTVEEYVPLFVDFKLKVAEAEAVGIDTIAAVKKELLGYKEQMVLPTIVNNDFIEAEARKTYEQTAARFDGQDLLTASHILVLMRQDATQAQQDAAKARIDSIYKVLQGGADFAEVAKACSEDPGSAPRGGALGQFGKGMMIPDFENAAYALKPGQISKPIKSTVGWHIIKLTDRHPFEPYEHHHDNIIKFLEQRGIKEVAANAYIDSLAAKTGKERAEVVDELYSKLLDEDVDTKYLAQEYYDGTLMYEISKSSVWDKIAGDEAGLVSYFAKHKKQYAWDAPRFRGVIIYAKDKATIAASKKLVKSVEESKWATSINKAFNTDSTKLVRVERGLYKKGDRPVVDVKAFKQTVEVKPMKDFPEYDVIGKVLKAPQTYLDVKSQVTTDYQAEKEKEWVEQLRAKYAVEVYDDVVKTVNKH